MNMLRNNPGSKIADRKSSATHESCSDSSDPYLDVDTLWRKVPSYHISKTRRKKPPLIGLMESAPTFIQFIILREHYEIQ